LLNRRFTGGDQGKLEYIFYIRQAAIECNIFHIHESGSGLTLGTLRLFETYQLLQTFGALVVKTPLHSFLESLLGLIAHTYDRDSASHTKCSQRA